MASGTADRVELQVFLCREAYVYQVPPATTVGHRADTWNVNKWLSEVTVRVLTCGEECFVRLEDCKSGELFAECPVPPNVPLVTVVEPVIDSSRYFVLRIVDRDTERHAFIGLGFRERSESSDFNAALYEHQQYMRRRRVAEAQRKEYEQRQQQGNEGEEGEAPPAVDYSIKPGEKITIKINVPKQEKVEGFVSSASSRLTSPFNLFSSPSGLVLPPPPGAKQAQQHQQGDSLAGAMCVSPKAASPGGAGVQGEFAGGCSHGSGSSRGLGGDSEGQSVAGAWTEPRAAAGCSGDGRGEACGEVPAAGAAQDALKGGVEAEVGGRGAEEGGAMNEASWKLQELELAGKEGGLARAGRQSEAAGGGGGAGEEEEEDAWGDFTGS